MTKHIAIPAKEDGMLDGHFGHCPYFVIFEIKENSIVGEEKVVPPPHEPGLLPKWLAGKGITDIIAGGMGHKAIRLFNEMGINVFTGAPVQQAHTLGRSFLEGSIEFTANYCNH